MSNNLALESGKRYHHLDVYKGVCMFLIILTHFRWETTERLKYFFPFWVDMAVPVLMVITGFLYAMSFQKKDSSLENSYQLKELIIKWLRFVVPFIPVLLVELFAKAFVLHEKLTGVLILKAFAVGGYGPGSYYFPVMLQIVVLLPVIITSVRKFRFKGLLLWLFINVLFEFLKTLTGMSAGLYRLLSFRYLFVLSYGVYLYYSFNETDRTLQKDVANSNRKHLFIGGTIGLVYITTFNYLGLKPVITAMWTTTSVFAVLWIVPITYWLFKKVDVKNQLFEIFGQASFDIFLVQMVYYCSLARYVYRFINNSCFQMMFGFLFCLLFGVLYYKVEYPIQRMVISRIKK